MKSIIVRRVLTRFTNWVAASEGQDSIFVTALRGKVVAYINDEPLPCSEPPMWQPFPFQPGDVISEL